MATPSGVTRTRRFTRLERERLLGAWSERWPGLLPVAPYEFKWNLPDRWVRFHSLPESKRYADTADEWEVLLGRHHTVLRAVAGAEGHPTLLVVTRSWSGSERPTRRGAAVARVAPFAQHWVSAVIDDDPEWLKWDHAYLGRVALAREALDPLLRVVADDETSGVVIAPSDFEWLYHPYDGGADVFLPSRERRDLLSLAHHRWLSRYPGGL